MKLPNWFKITWWLLVLLGTSVALVTRFNNISSGIYTPLDAFIFILWVILILCPIFSEIKFFGLGVKRELEDLKNTTQNQITNLRNEIQNKFNLNQTVNITSSTMAIPLQTDNSTSAPNSETFNVMQKKILATLWHYQQIHSKDDITRKWTFAVNFYAPFYPEYLEAIAKLMNTRLISLNPENNQCMLTDFGINFMKQNEQLQTKDNLFTF